MLTLAITAILLEIANKASSLTGGADGLSGHDDRWPIFGLFSFDMFGKTAFSIAWSCCSSAGWSCAASIYSPFGALLTGIRENIARMHAIGAPVYWRLVHRLHDLGGAGRHRRRAAHADDPVRRPQRARPRALRRDR